MALCQAVFACFGGGHGEAYAAAEGQYVAGDSNVFEGCRAPWGEVACQS